MLPAEQALLDRFSANVNALEAHPLVDDSLRLRLDALRGGVQELAQRARRQRQAPSTEVSQLITGMQDLRESQQRTSRQLARLQRERLRQVPLHAPRQSQDYSSEPRSTESRGRRNSLGAEGRATAPFGHGGQGGQTRTPARALVLGRGAPRMVGGARRRIAQALQDQGLLRSSGTGEATQGSSIASSARVPAVGALASGGFFSSRATPAGRLAASQLRGHYPQTTPSDVCSVCLHDMEASLACWLL